MYMSRFDDQVKMKLGDILKTFTNSSYSMDTSCQAAMGDASPIWNILGITEKEYYIKYPPVDVSGNAVPTVDETEKEEPKKDESV